MAKSKYVRPECEAPMSRNTTASASRHTILNEKSYGRSACVSVAHRSLTKNLSLAFWAPEYFRHSIVRFFKNTFRFFAEKMVQNRQLPLRLTENGANDFQKRLFQCDRLFTICSNQPHTLFSSTLPPARRGIVANLSWPILQIFFMQHSHVVRHVSTHNVSAGPY